MVRSLAMLMVPDVGLYSPTIILSRVVFPVPLAPIRPIFSPGFMCQFASSYRARAPISNVRLFIAIISAQRYDFGGKSESSKVGKVRKVTLGLVIIAFQKYPPAFHP